MGIVPGEYRTETAQMQVLGTACGARTHNEGWLFSEKKVFCECQVVMSVRTRPGDTGVEEMLVKMVLAGLQQQGDKWKKDGYKRIHKTVQETVALALLLMRMVHKV